MESIRESIAEEMNTMRGFMRKMRNENENRPPLPV